MEKYRKNFLLFKIILKWRYHLIYFSKGCLGDNPGRKARVIHFREYYVFKCCYMLWKWSITVQINYFLNLFVEPTKICSPHLNKKRLLPKLPRIVFTVRGLLFLSISIIIFSSYAGLSRVPFDIKNEFPRQLILLCTKGTNQINPIIISLAGTSK